MPYAPVQTQLQMAPLNILPGVRLRQAVLRDRNWRGMGQVEGPCPTTDPTDPCNIAMNESILSSLPPSSTVPLLSIPNIPQNPALPNLTVSQWLSQNQGTILLVGGGLFLFTILSSLGRRR